MTTLFLIHGRGQHTAPGVPAGQVAEHAEAIRRRWLHALNTGLHDAGRPAIPDAAPVLFPFYGNAFRDAVAEREGSGPGPDLARWSTGQPLPADVQAVCEVKAGLIHDVTELLRFDPDSASLHPSTRHPESVHPESLHPAVGEPTARGLPAGVGRPWWELDELLRVPWLRAALQFLAERAGVSARVIEEYFTDVAYYLGCAEVRQTVLAIVERALADVPMGEPVVVAGHSLGSVVAYDALIRGAQGRSIALVATTGSPLGLPVVQRHLLGGAGDGPVPVPAVVPARSGAWVNGYDVRDVVAILNPLGPRLEQAAAAQVRDVRVGSGDEPHAVIGYLENAAVAEPIGHAVVSGSRAVP
ncbi:lipase family protein [Citricoccus nitrophenolicus]|uniref:PGAP1-like protein n=1 Tax=Citricoccus muralis TaxID=169134 RepID=A0A3D9LAM1_9MICC|nr:hypothetical protein [Citricoccus muralis]REE02910.1 hypothetical protein C8E99_0700 [Citricoccus muralis]